MASRIPLKSGSTIISAFVTLESTHVIAHQWSYLSWSLQTKDARKQCRPTEQTRWRYQLVTCHYDKTHRRKKKKPSGRKGIFWLINQGHSLPWRDQGDRGLGQLVTLLSSQGKERLRLALSSLSAFYTIQHPSQRMVPPTVWSTSHLSFNLIKKTPTGMPRSSFPWGSTFYQALTN